MKTIGFSMVLGNFQKINVFEKSMQKVQFWVHFGMPKPLKIDRKSCLKLMLVSIPFFLRFFLFFNDFGSIWGGPGRSKNWRNLQKNVFGACFKRVWTFGTSLEATLERFYLIFGGFGMDFGCLLGGFSFEFEDNSKYFR